jgi:tetratricopeptide (TPR) repeat protein
LTVEDYFREAERYDLQSEYRKAISCYIKIVCMEPSNAYAFNRLGNDFDKIGKADISYLCY